MESKIRAAIDRRDNSTEKLYHIVVTPRSKFIDALVSLSKNDLYVYESETVARIHQARYPKNNVTTLYDFILLITRKIKIPYNGINPKVRGAEAWYANRQFEKYNRGTFDIKKFEPLEEWFDIRGDVFIGKGHDDPIQIHETDPTIFEYMTFNDYDNIYIFVDKPNTYYDILPQFHKFINSEGLVISQITVFGNIPDVAKYVSDPPDQIQLDGSRNQKTNIPVSNLRKYLQDRRGVLYFGPTIHRLSYDLKPDYTLMAGTALAPLADNIITESPWLISWFTPTEIIESNITDRDGSNNTYDHSATSIALVNNLPYVNVIQTQRYISYGQSYDLGYRLNILFDTSVDDQNAEYASKLALPYKMSILLRYWTSMNLPAFPLVITFIFASRAYQIYSGQINKPKPPESRSSSVGTLAALYNELLIALDYNLINYQVIRQWCLSDERNYEPQTFIVANEQILQFQQTLGFDIGRFNVENYVTTLSNFLQSYDYPIYTLIDGFYTHDNKNYTLTKVFKFTDQIPAVVALLSSKSQILQYEVPVQTDDQVERSGDDIVRQELSEQDNLKNFPLQDAGDVFPNQITASDFNRL